MKLGDFLKSKNETYRYVGVGDLDKYNNVENARGLIEEASLSDLQRRRFLAIFVYDQTFEQLAKDAGVSVKALKSNVNFGCLRILMYLHDGKVALEPVKLTDSIIRLGLPTMAYFAMRRAGIDTVEDLMEVSLSKIKSIRQMGPINVDATVDALRKHGFVCTLVDEWERSKR